MEMDSKVIAGVSAAIALGILTYGIYHMASSSSSSNGKTKKLKSTTKSSSNVSSKPKSGVKSQEKRDDSDEDLSLRGYKKTSTGKTTTYFNRELSAEEKVLLGDSTPKRIDSPSSNIGGSSSPNPAGGSVWNSAGTYEEKNISEWSQTNLKKKLRKVTHRVADGEITVTSVTKVEGESTVTMVRGKKKYLYDMTATINWKLQSKSHEVTGSMVISDITADNDHEFQVSDIYSSSLRSEYNPLVEKFIKSTSSVSLKSAVSKAIESEMKEAH